MKNVTYILKCNDNSLYTGWTNDITHRLKMHNEGKGAKYTRGRGPVELVYLEEFETKQEAMGREAKILPMVFKPRKLKCIDYTANSINDSTSKQPSKGCVGKRMNDRSDRNDTKPSHGNIHYRRHPLWTSNPEHLKYDTKDCNSPDDRQ